MSGMIEEIKVLYAQVDYKKGAILAISKATGRKPNTIKGHWFSEANFWSIPESEQETVKRELETIVNKQKVKVA